MIRQTSSIIGITAWNKREIWIGRKGECNHDVSRICNNLHVQRIPNSNLKMEKESDYLKKSCTFGQDLRLYFIIALLVHYYLSSNVS